MTLRHSLRNKLLTVSGRLYNKAEHNKWLAPAILIPLQWTFDLANALETQSERRDRTAKGHYLDFEKYELLDVAVKMTRHPEYLYGNDFYRENGTPGSNGSWGGYSSHQIQTFIDENFDLVWQHLQSSCDHDGNLEFVAAYVRRNIDENASPEERKTYLKELIGDESTASRLTGKIEERVQVMEQEKMDALRKLAVKTIAYHGFSPATVSLERLKQEVAKKGQYRRFDITGDDVIDFAMENYQDILDNEFHDWSEASVTKVKDNFQRWTGEKKSPQHFTPTIP